MSNFEKSPSQHTPPTLESIVARVTQLNASKEDETCFDAALQDHMARLPHVLVLLPDFLNGRPNSQRELEQHWEWMTSNYGWALSQKAVAPLAQPAPTALKNEVWQKLKSVVRDPLRLDMVDRLTQREDVPTLWWENLRLETSHYIKYCKQYGRLLPVDTSPFQHDLEKTTLSDRRLLL